MCDGEHVLHVMGWCAVCDGEDDSGVNSLAMR